MTHRLFTYHEAYWAFGSHGVSAGKGHPDHPGIPLIIEMTETISEKEAPYEQLISGRQYVVHVSQSGSLCAVLPEGGLVNVYGEDSYIVIECHR